MPIYGSRIIQINTDLYSLLLEVICLVSCHIELVQIYLLRFWSCYYSYYYTITHNVLNCILVHRWTYYRFNLFCSIYFIERTNNNSSKMFYDISQNIFLNIYIYIQRHPWNHMCSEKIRQIRHHNSQHGHSESN